MDDKLMEMAREAGFKVWNDGRITAADNGISGSATTSLAKFAALVAAAERERCAVEVETSSQDLSRYEYAAAIRAMK